MFGNLDCLRAKRQGGFTEAPNLGAGELGDGLGALGDGVLGELTREDEADRGLDLAGREGGLLVVAGELAGLAGEAVEDVVDEGVHDGHTFLGHTGVWVYLFQDFVDVKTPGLISLSSSWCSSFSSSFGHLIMIIVLKLKL